MTRGGKVHWQNSSYLHPRSGCISVPTKVTHKEFTSLCKSPWFMKISSYQCYLIQVAWGPGNVILKNAHFEPASSPRLPAKSTLQPAGFGPNTETRWRALLKNRFYIERVGIIPIAWRCFSCLSHVYFLLVLHIYLFFNSFASKGHFKVMPLPNGKST